MPDNPRYNPQIHHRRSMRLKGYDYSQVGAYFITICVKDKACLFGKITDGEMYLNEAGQMIDNWWQKIPEKFTGIELGEYQIMPNHFHAIVINVGADPRVCPENRTETAQSTNTGKTNVGADPRVRPENCNETITPSDTDQIMTETDVEQILFGSSLHEGEHMGSPLHKVVQWFKTMSTNDYIRSVKLHNWPAFNGKLWQRNYYEHIIRNDKSFQYIARYVYNNPINWQNDNFFVE